MSLTPIKTAFGLAFDIEKASDTKSGFRPAHFPISGGAELFGSLRLKGFAALLNIGFARKLVLIGGDEGRYRDEVPVINRAYAIQEMLVKDYGCNRSQIEALTSNSNTLGNVQIIRQTIELHSLSFKEYAVVSSHYHLPRAERDLLDAGILSHFYPAEAFSLLEGCTKDDLVKELGGGELAARLADEIEIMARKLEKNYVPRTDDPSKR